MKNAFKKGQEVTYIADWDRKGTVTFRHAVVYSCGVKQMVLTDAETGEEMGRHFRPALGEIVGTFPRMTDEAARAACIFAAEHIIASERARLENCLAASAKSGRGSSYDAGMQKNIAALHEPRALSYGEASAAIKAAIAGSAA